MHPVFLHNSNGCVAWDLASPLNGQSSHCRPQIIEKLDGEARAHRFHKILAGEAVLKVGRKYTGDDLHLSLHSGGQLFALQPRQGIPPVAVATALVVQDERVVELVAPMRGLLHATDDPGYGEVAVPVHVQQFLGEIKQVLTKTVP